MGSIQNDLKNKMNKEISMEKNGPRQIRNA